MPILEGLKAINEILIQPNWDIDQLILAARDRAMQLGTGAGLPAGAAFGLNACQTWYGVNAQGVPNQEIASWFLSILLAEYTAGLLAQKVEEGHCREHRKKPDFKPCIDMAKEHLRMLGLFKEDLKKLVQEVEELERRTQLPQPPAQAP
jgi:hypothetical protein